MPFFFLAKDKIDAWAGRLAEEAHVCFPAVREDRVHFDRYDPKWLTSESGRPVWALERIRAAEPIKGFLFAAREMVARFPDTGQRNTAREGRQIVIGAKSCD